ncbi:MAG: hypothetical protein JEZ08_01415 [Clostridiales bacterium]|nr:hypothetical protein [Clostridiales bacterium]
MLILISYLIVRQKNNKDKTSDSDYEALILKALGNEITILNYKAFEDYLVVLYKNVKDELNQKILKVHPNAVEYVSGLDLEIQLYYGTIQKYGFENYMIITGVKGSGSHMEVYFHGSLGTVNTLHSRILDIEEEYFIKIVKLDRSTSYQFLVDSSTKMLDEVYEEIQ